MSRLPVTALDHVALRVPDPEAVAGHYRSVFGLVEAGREGGGAIRLSRLPRNGETVAHHEVILYPGEQVALDHLGLAVPDAEALRAAAETLRARDQDVSGPAAFEEAHGPSVRLRDPDSNVVELLVPPARLRRPAGSAPFEIVKLSHVNLKSPDPPRMAQWWAEVMDFRLSDRMGETFYWLRCNPDHTTVAIVRSATAGFHHIGYEIASWEDVRLLADHLLAHGQPIEFGPGRHGPGNAIFVYLLDPFRIRWEFLSGLERIDDDGKGVPLWDQERRAGIVNLWGPRPPEEFLKW